MSTTTLILAMLIILIIGYGFWSNRQLQIEHIPLLVTNLSKKLEQVKISHISDLHFRRLKLNPDDLLEAISKESPDLIFVTGDTIDRTEDLSVTTIANFIDDLVNIAPTFVIEGNHEETCDDFDQWRQSILATRATLLENDVTTVTIKQTNIAVVGLRNEITDLPPEEKNKLKDYPISLILAHHPELYSDYLANFKETTAVAIFAGHAHGGQIRLPYIGGLLGPDNTWLAPYTSGIYFDQATKQLPLIVSRGLANSRFPLRINNKPHLITLTLKQK